MIRIESTSAYKTYILKKQFNVQVRDLTTLLITALNIDPYSKSLITACGVGNEQDNCSAVYHWVLLQACCSSCLLELDVKTLQHRLVRHLLDHTSQQEYIE